MVLQRACLASSSSFLCNRGPESKEELAAWDEHWLQALGPSRVARVLDTLRNGAVYTTDFSGMDFPKEALAIIARAVACDREESSQPLFRHVRSSDWGDLQRNVLVELSARETLGGTACVFGDLRPLPQKGGCLVEGDEPG